jgi:hypothetical protein
MDVLEWIVPYPKKATIGRSHVDLNGCRIQGGTGTAVTALRAALGAAPEAGATEVEIRVEPGSPPESYTLTAGATGVLIVGADPAGAFYGAQTLLAMAAAPCAEHRVCVPESSVRDWPDLPLRGTIEGFYGTPWTHGDRMEHLRFSGRHKLNTYVYAPKDDPFHRERWREPYPEEELARLGELVAQAAAQHVRLVFALSPGLSMVYGDPAERAALPQDVLVWWTGSDVVVGEIPAADMTAAAASYGHRVALWDNFPVNDFDFERVFLGPLTGRATELGGVPLEGITANPMVAAAASRLALTTVADYAWHLAAYEPGRSHERAVRLVPGAAELRPLVEACSSWPPGASQSPALSALCDDALAGRPAGRLRAELTRLAELPQDVPGTLARELGRWVSAARDMGTAGLAALDLLTGRSESLVEAAREALARAEAHEANVLRGVIPPFARAALERAAQA